MVTCTLAKGEGVDASIHRDIRAFSRPAPGAAWRLVTRLTEPVPPLP